MMTWAAFRRLFSRHFLSPEYYVRKRQEFLNFRQGNLTITKFDSTFRRLARHHLVVYKNPHEMMVQLKITLNDDICKLLAPQAYAFYEEMIEAVLKGE